MWTLKRVMLLLAGTVLFLLAYVVYDRVLGGINGLPPLPESCYPEVSSTSHIPHTTDPPLLEELLQQAWGTGCKELKWMIRLVVQPRGLVLAAEDFKITKDGRVLLAPLHIALFGKSTEPGQFPEINTIEAEEAYLKFDEPVTNYLDMSRHKLVAAELVKNVWVRNNRRTPAKNDDLSLQIPTGSVFYEDNVESKQHIWTSEHVTMLDEQSQPEPMVVTAKGMDVWMNKEPAQPRPGDAPPHKRKGDNNGSVERVVLRETVRMTLWMDSDSQSGFLDNGREKKPETGPGQKAKADKTQETAGRPREKKPEDRSKVLIETDGHFEYIVLTDMAHFEHGQQKGAFPEQVKVTRVLGDPDHRHYDQLFCDKLDLKFLQKAGAQPRTGDAASQQMGSREIEWVEATGRDVTISSDSESFSAVGTFFRYETKDRKSILRSDLPAGTQVLKDASEILAPEIQLIGGKDGSQMRALGPGEIRHRDKATDRRQAPMIARWRDSLTSGKDEGRDLYVLTGGASFEDPQSTPPRILRGDTIKVWMDEGSARAKAEKPVEPPSATASPEQQTRRVNKVEATGNVSCRSPEVEIQNSHYLLVIFKDPPPDSVENPVSAPATGTPAQPLTGLQTAKGSGSTAPEGATAADKTQQQPIVLSADSVTATFVRSEARNDLQTLWTQGKVHVHQEPSTKGDKPVDITGDDLQLKHYADGNWLHVTADPTTGNIAHLQLNKIQIAGPQVTIDQRTNHVDVQGKGAMQLESATTLQGEPLNKQTAPPVSANPKAPAEPPKTEPVYIYWEDNMDFNGRLAIFSGNVVAEQKNSRLGCKRLDVNLDHPVSLKEGEKKGESPTIKDLNCVQNVVIEDSTFDASKLLQKYQRVECPELVLHNDDGRVEAAGRGVVRIWQPDTDDSPMMPGAGSGPNPGRPIQAGSGSPAGSAGQSKNKNPEQKLTRIEYANSMWADKKQNIVKFRGNVEVFNLPTKNKDLPLSPAKLPPGCFYMKSEFLEVLGRMEGVRKYQYMHGQGNVVVQSPELFGRAADVTYDEEKDQFVFTGEPGNLAQVTKIDATKSATDQPKTVAALKIIYERKTGKMHLEGVYSAGGGG
jgi:lipopolysaccharide export system protein LptA